MQMNLKILNKFNYKLLIFGEEYAGYNFIFNYNSLLVEYNLK